MAPYIKRKRGLIAIGTGNGSGIAVGIIVIIVNISLGVGAADDISLCVIGCSINIITRCNQLCQITLTVVAQRINISLGVFVTVDFIKIISIGISADVAERVGGCKHIPAGVVSISKYLPIGIRLFNCISLIIVIKAYIITATITRTGNNP